MRVMRVTLCSLTYFHVFDFLIFVTSSRVGWTNNFCESYFCLRTTTEELHVDVGDSLFSLVVL